MDLSINIEKIQSKYLPYLDLTDDILFYGFFPQPKKIVSFLQFANKVFTILTL